METLYTRFFLIRHAQTIANRQKIIQGQTESPLTAEGERAAKIWAEKLTAYSFGHIIATPLSRTLHTARIINGLSKSSVFVDARLMEQDWGLWSRMTLARIKKRYPSYLEQQTRSGWAFAPPFGESRKSVLHRARSAILSAARRFSGEKILVICHQGILKCLFYHLFGRQFLPHEPVLLNKDFCHAIIANQRGELSARVNLFSLNDGLEIHT